MFQCFLFSISCSLDPNFVRQLPWTHVCQVLDGYEVVQAIESLGTFPRVSGGCCVSDVAGATGALCYTYGSKLK